MNEKRKVVILTYGMELNEFQYVEKLLKRVLTKDFFIEQIGGFNAKEESVQEEFKSSEKQSYFPEDKKDKEEKSSRSSNNARGISHLGEERFKRDLEQLDWTNGWY